MILKHPLNILHAGDQQNIAKKDQQPDTCLQNGDQCLGCCHQPQRTGSEIRQHDKQAHAQYQGKCHSTCHHRFVFLLFLFLPLHGFLGGHRLQVSYINIIRCTGEVVGIHHAQLL